MVLAGSGVSVGIDRWCKWGLTCLHSEGWNRFSTPCIIYLLYLLFVLCRFMTMRRRNCWRPEVSASKCLIPFLLLNCVFWCEAKSVERSWSYIHWSLSTVYCTAKSNHFINELTNQADMLSESYVSNKSIQVCLKVKKKMEKATYYYVVSMLTFWMCSGPVSQYFCTF